MHQHPRPAPRAASTAGNQATNPERTNNSRDQPMHRTRSSQDFSSYTERAGGEAGGERPRAESSAVGSQDRETTKLNQIIQHFHSKAALMICSARAQLPQVHTKSGDVKQNRWFNIVLDDTDVLLDDLHEWKRPDLSEVRPPPLVIETFLDTSNLGQNQVLVIADESGKQWDVSDALTSSADSSPRPTKNGGKHCEVVLERWTVELGDAAGYSVDELNDQLPNVYKKGVVLFRSLYAFLRLLPTWKLYRRLGRQPGNQQALKLKFRVRQGPSLTSKTKDSLYTPLCPSDLSSSSDSNASEHVEHHGFLALRCPAGPLHLRVDYRRNQDFGVADSESLLSSRFLGIDEGLPTLQAGRSLPGARTQQDRARMPYGSSADNKPTARRPRGMLGQYGSLGNYYATTQRGSSGAEQELPTQTTDEDTKTTDSMNRVLELNPNSTGQFAARRTSSGLRSGKSPFKAGSLEVSPRDLPPSLPRLITPPNQVAFHTTEALATSYEKHNEEKRLEKERMEREFRRVVADQKGEIRDVGRPDYSSEKRSSLSTIPQQAALRTPSLQNETAIASSGSSSPRPAPIGRFQSSFSGRTPKPGRSGGSGASSARGSSSGGGADASSGAAKSVTDDDDAITSFIALTEGPQIKSHALVRPPSGSGRYSINMSKYTNMRDTTTQMADEMSSSSLIQASSTPPSRRMSNVPPLSTSSSPSRNLAYAPHVRSRLSTHSIVEETTRSGLESPKLAEEDEESEDEPFMFHLNEDEA